MTIIFNQVLENPSAVESGKVYRIRIARIRRFEKQPRKFFDEESLKRLGKRLRIRQRQPISVRRLLDDPEHDFELIDGERRWRSAKLEGLDSLNAIVKEVKDENDQFEDSIISNFGSEDHPPLEKAEALQNLKDRTGMTNEQIAEACGISYSYVWQLLTLIKLKSDVKAHLDPNLPKEKQLSVPTALRLASLPKYLQSELAEEILDRGMNQKEARFLISRKTHEKGVIIKNRDPHRDYDIITGFVRRAMTDARLILEMPDALFEKMFESRTEAEHTTFIEGLGQLQNSIQKILKKVPVKTT